MNTTRRRFLTCLGAGLGAAVCAPERWSFAAQNPPKPLYAPGEFHKIDSKTRRFHISATFSDVLNEGLQENNRPMPPNPNAVKLNSQSMAELWREAGVTDVWLDVYSYGVFADAKTIDGAIERMKNFGYDVHFITVPIGHPDATFTPEVAPRRVPYERFDGRSGWGVSIHDGVAKDNIESVRTLADQYGPCHLFWDDDYRFSPSPSEIGGCVCAECKADFMAKSGFSASRWDALIGDLRANHDTKDVRAWIDYFCDRLTKVFRDAQALAPEVDLGIMVMGMGSEKAGIRLDDYRGSILRVGEWMFTDEQYGNVKNKTIELYSSLMHRRFVEPGRAFSETTIIQELCAENYASKLSVSTLSDVRNTMFMCPIPASYWGLIAPRMKQEERFHSHIYGAKAKGPFKHFWGLADRYMAGYSAYSLFLATGVPFEVCDELPTDGWAFLGDASAAEMERGELTSPGAKCVARVNSDSDRFVTVPETFDELFAFRKTLLPTLREQKVPYVEEETPVVLGWYPDAKAFYLWNVEKEDKVVTLRVGEKTIAVELKALDSAMVLEKDGALSAV